MSADVLFLFGERVAKLDLAKSKPAAGIERSGIEVCVLSVRRISVDGASSPVKAFNELVLDAPNTSDKCAAGGYLGHPPKSCKW